MASVLNTEFEVLAMVHALALGELGKHGMWSQLIRNLESLKTITQHGPLPFSPERSQCKEHRGLGTICQSELEQQDSNGSIHQTQFSRWQFPR